VQNERAPREQHLDLFLYHLWLIKVGTVHRMTLGREEVHREDLHGERAVSVPKQTLTSKT
jgi:hypothetical protein